MGLPAQVQKEADAVAQLEKRLALVPDDAPGNEPPAEPTQDQPVEPEAVTTTGEPEAPPAAEKPTKSAPARPFEKDDEATWKQRYYGLQGVFNAQVPQLQHRVRELEAQLQAPPKPAQAAVETPPAKARITQQDVDAFGQDLIDMVDRKARDIADQLSAAYDARIRHLEEALTKATTSFDSVAKVQAQTIQSDFFAALDRDVPNWSQLQETEECQAWLGTKVPGLRITWDDALKSAAESYDAVAAKEVFSQFIAAHPQFAVPTTKPVKQVSREVQRQVAPERTNATPARTTPTKKVYTATEFQSESDRLIRLAKQGKHEEAGRIEAELNAAMAEGRIRP